jgi:Tfp pilus assembly protein PilN
MIRINLLPAKRGRVSKKAIDFRNFLMATGAGMAAVVLAGGLMSWLMASRISGLEHQKSDLETELTALQAKAAKIATFEEDKKTFEEKIRVIARLKTDQGRPVVFLDKLAHRMPERVWLMRLGQAKGTVTITGRAIANSDIVDMIRLMKEEGFLIDVQLVESRRVRDGDLSSYEFTLTGTSPEEAEPVEETST